MELPLDDTLVIEIEVEAAGMARAAGEILRDRFGKSLEVEYKDKNMRDPVTSADKESQAYLCEAISRRFASHGILGEESPGEEEDDPSPDFLWVLDPLDGTTNFLNGLPVYGVSVGVLYRGAPLAGALFIPWPGGNGGFVLHARRGGGAWMDGERISIPQSDGPEATRLTGLPGSFGARYRLRKALRQRVGEVRVTGSITYELALTARGAFQYVAFGGAKIWDVAAGVLIVMEAGGSVLVRSRKSRRWEPLTSFYPEDRTGSTRKNGIPDSRSAVQGEKPSSSVRSPSLKDLRKGTTTLIAGGTQVTDFVAANLESRSSVSARVAGLLRRAGLRGR